MDKRRKNFKSSSELKIMVCSVGIRVEGAVLSQQMKQHILKLSEKKKNHSFYLRRHCL